MWSTSAVEFRPCSKLARAYDGMVGRVRSPSRIRVCVLGIWHLGAVTAACLASLGYEVTGVEDNPRRVEALQRGLPPIYEPGLEELFVREMAADRLRFVGNPGEAVANAQLILFTEDVPVDERDQADVSGLLATAGTIAPWLQPGATLIVLSQVPVGTCARLVQVVSEANPRAGVHVAYCPENLRLGDAIERFLRPDMIVIGADTAAARARVEELYRPLDVPKVVMDIRSAEMTKHALNSLLATCISFGNEIGVLCEEVGADARLVVSALRLDRRIGPGMPLYPGPPFSGGTLARDVRVLHRLARNSGVEAPLLESVLAVNDRQKTLAVRKLEHALGDLRGVRVAVLGLTYKAGTSTIRRSLALEVIHALEARSVIIAAYDPMADLSELGTRPHFQCAKDPYAAARGADALVIMTDWPEFRTLDLGTLRRTMRRGVVIDTQNLLDPAAVAAEGLAYYGVGRSS